MAGIKTSVYLAEDLAADVKADGRSLADLIRAGLDAAKPDPPVTRSELHAELAALLATIQANGTSHRRDGRACQHAVYRLTCDEYDALRARAAGHCEICGIAEHETTSGKLVIDHFRAGDDSFVRGLICKACNSGTMVCIDSTKPWGANRKWEAKAREYEANSFQRPSPAALALMAARPHEPRTTNASKDSAPVAASSKASRTTRPRSAPTAGELVNERQRDAREGDGLGKVPHRCQVKGWCETCGEMKGGKR